MENNFIKKTVCRYYLNNGECFYGDGCQFSHEDHGQTSNINLFEKSLDSNVSYNFNSQIPSESKLSSYLNDLKLDNNATKTPNTEKKSFISSRNFQNSSLEQNSTNKRQNSNNTNNYFVFNDDVKLEALKKNNFLLNLNNSEITFTDIPSQVGTYVNLYPLDGAITTPSPTFNLITTIYKATNIKTGKVVCLRRIHSFTLVKSNLDKILLQKIKEWKLINHVNIVKFHEVFITKEFGDNSLIFVYDFHSASKSLMTQYFSNHNSSFTNKNSTTTNFNRPYSQQQQAQRQKLLPEQLLWSYLIQILSAVRLIHSKGLVHKIIDLKKILIISGFPPSDTQNQINNTQYCNPRVKLNCCCILDVIKNEFDKETINILGEKEFLCNLQFDDLRSIGKVFVFLLTNSITDGPQINLIESLNSVSRFYSEELILAVYQLLTANFSVEEKKSSLNIIDSLNNLIGPRFYEQIDHAYQKIDNLDYELCKELDNSRLFRLLAKLGCIVERPELGMNEKWSETGDRYLLKLFRDYLFHQNKEDGLPFVDLGHIISTLNKLDAGCKEKICLTSRDRQNLIIVSFAELKKYCENSFQQLFCKFNYEK